MINKSMPCLVDNKIILLGKKSAAKCKIEAVLHQLGCEVADISQANESFRMCCYVSPNAGIGHRPEKFEVNFNEIDRAAEIIKKNGEGRMLLISGSIGTKAIHWGWAEEAAKEAYMIQYWKNLAVKTAPYQITCNILEIGYAPFLGNVLPCEEDIFFNRLIIRREVTPQDAGSAIKFLLSKDAAYMVGVTLRLDGGLDCCQVPAVRPFKKKATPMVQTMDILKDKFSLKGKTALIFGCSSGIGRSAAISLAARGASLVLSARREERLEQLSQEVGTENIYIKTDVENEAEIEKAIELAWKRFKKIDILIYASGQGCLVNDLECSQSFEQMMKVNFKGYQTACLQLIERWKEKGIKGSIVGISTIDTLKVPSANLGSYSITKAALSQFSRNLAFSTARYGIRVNCVMPGYISTEMLEWTEESYRRQWIEQIPAHRLGKAEDVSGAISFLASPASDYITGENIVIDGGYILGYVPEIGRGVDS